MFRLSRSSSLPTVWEHALWLCQSIPRTISKDILFGGFTSTWCLYRIFSSQLSNFFHRMSSAPMARTYAQHKWSSLSTKSILLLLIAAYSSGFLAAPSLIGLTRLLATISVPGQSFGRYRCREPVNSSNNGASRYHHPGFINRHQNPLLYIRVSSCPTHPIQRQISKTDLQDICCLVLYISSLPSALP